MAINDAVFRSILAMDSYNRGYDAGIRLEGSQVGNATIRTDALPADSQSVSFFAQAYTWNGETVISYRGTDEGSFFDPGADPQNGYDLAFGGIWDNQTRLAAQFYQTVRATGAAGSVELVGHSLGGGLAGFIICIYGSPAMIFDNMPFERSIEEFKTDIDRDLNAEGSHC